MGEVATLLNSETPNLPIAKAIKVILVILLFIPARCEGGWLSSIFRLNPLIPLVPHHNITFRTVISRRGAERRRAQRTHFLLSLLGLSEIWRMGEVATLPNSETPNLPTAKAIKVILVILLFIPARCEGGWLSSIFRFHQLGESPYIKKGVQIIKKNIPSLRPLRPLRSLRLIEKEGLVQLRFLGSPPPHSPRSAP